MRIRYVAALVAALVLSACGTAPAAREATINVGAVFPLTGPQSPLAMQEYVGVEIAADFVNADGGVHGKRIQLIARDLTAVQDAMTRVAELQAAGVQSIIGAYSSGLSMPVSQAAQARRLLYWEAGAVADQLTGRGYPLVFRVGATGRNLGEMSSHFAASVLAPLLGTPPAALRVVTVHNLDAYPVSVAAAVRQQAGREGMPVVADVVYDAQLPDWTAVLDRVRAAKPDILVLSSYIADGVDFRRAMLASGLHVKALIGSTMAQCIPDFGAMLGADAIGVFASDRPPHGFNPQALNDTGRAVYNRFAAAYRQRFNLDATEEALAGFSAAWTLFHYVMPGSIDLRASSMALAARALDLPAGTLANGAGVRFSTSADTLGQNTRAASVIWQWQGVRHSVTVYPPVFATGTIGFIPLPR